MILDSIFALCLFFNGGKRNICSFNGLQLKVFMRDTRKKNKKNHLNEWTIYIQLLLVVCILLEFLNMSKLWNHWMLFHPNNFVHRMFEAHHKTLHTEKKVELKIIRNCAWNSKNGTMLEKKRQHSRHQKILYKCNAQIWNDCAIWQVNCDCVADPRSVAFSARNDDDDGQSNCYDIASDKLVKDVRLSIITQSSKYN